MREVRLLLGARADLMDINFYYGQFHEGLAEAFLSTAEASLHKIEKYPLSRGVWKKDFRRMRIGRFPYLVYYKVFDTEILVYAVIHEKRGPTAIQKQLNRN